MMRSINLKYIYRKSGISGTSISPEIISFSAFSTASFAASDRCVLTIPTPPSSKLLL